MKGWQAEERATLSRLMQDEEAKRAPPSAISERIRPGAEAAPWVCEAVQKLERQRDELLTALVRISLAEADSTTRAIDKVRDMARIARAALAGGK